MKLTIALTSALAAFASADFLEQDKACGDNKACERNCRGGRYDILTDLLHGIHFAYVLEANNPIKYSNPDCSFGLADGEEETAKALATCDSVGGKL